MVYFTLKYSVFWSRRGSILSFFLIFMNTSVYDKTFSTFACKKKEQKQSSKWKYGQF